MAKRLIGTFFISVMLAAGCSGGGSSEDTTSDGAIELEYWNLFGGGNGDLMDSMVESFNESQSDIYVNSVRLDWDEYYTKLITGVTSGEGPDVAVSHVTTLPELVDGGILYNLDDFTANIEVDWEDLNQNTLESTTFDGDHYAMPIDTHPLVMYYNKDHLQEAGVLNDNGEPEFDGTAEGLIEFLSTIKENTSEDVFTMAEPTSGDNPYRIWWGLYHQLGGEGVISDDLSEVEIDMDKAVQAADFIKDLYYEYEFIPLQMEEFQQIFENGNAATTIQGVWGSGVYNAAEDLDYGVVSISDLFGEPAQWGDSHSLVIPKQQNENKERSEAALTFINYIADHSLEWSKSGQVPSKTSLLESEEYQDLPYGETFEEISKDVAFPKQSDSTRAIKEASINNLNEIWEGQTSTEEALQQMENDIADVLTD
ncbi:ABC transporter substrate-binding protein [Salibacterium aidingense]|uniref:ABC transporter substrate-binding protein n=1 Tax=Salibacterium aidingense TaxID=384933 RepID=UPI003BBF685A